MNPKGTEKLSGDDALGEFGTKESGFAGGGPFSCMNCVHMKHVKNQDVVCTHPEVNDDPALEDRDRTGGFVIVDFDDCCRYVRPAED